MIEELKRLEREATGEPWKLADWAGAPPDPNNPNCIEGARIPPSTMFPDLGVQVMMFAECGDNTLNDAALICALRNSAKKMIAVVEAAEDFINSGYAFHKLKPLCAALNTLKEKGGQIR